MDSVADPDDFCPDPYPDLDPTSRSGSGFGSEFSLNFCYFSFFFCFIQNSDSDPWYIAGSGSEIGGPGFDHWQKVYVLYTVT